MKIEKINIKDAKEGDLVLSRVNGVCDGRGDYSVSQIHQYGMEHFVYVLRDVEIEDKTEPQEDYSNLCGSVWNIPSIISGSGRYRIGTENKSLSEIEVWLNKNKATRATDEDFIKQS